MIDKEKILDFVRVKNVVKSTDLVSVFNVTRQYVSRLLSELVSEKRLIKTGSTRNASYMLPAYAIGHPELTPSIYSKNLKNRILEEHKVLDDIENNFFPYQKMGENIKSIIEYSFSEMLNNAIEHSHSNRINISLSIEKKELVFIVEDFGVGVFRNIMQKRNLKSELEAVQDLLKGKTTTAPKLHSGEGIFFTSKIGDVFSLNSFGYKLIIDNRIKDVFLKKTKGQKKGTKVMFRIDINTKHHLNEVFRKYTNLTDSSDYGFDKTEIRVRLYTIGGVHISRSQARRILSGLDKFSIIVMDYDRVPMIGQAFADEIYRVFKNKKSDIKIENINMNDAVKFMVDRAINEAKKDQ